MKAAFFVDGFNLYHALDARAPGTNKQPYRKYFWLNLKKMAETLIGGTEELGHVYYFSAYAHFATWDPGRVDRHKIYVEALKSTGVKIVLGNFRSKDIKCLGDCRKTFVTHQEKETDVNIAVRLFESAVNGEYDKAYIISGDSDLIPAIDAVKRTFPSKKIGVVIPINRRADLLKNVCDFNIKLKEHHLATCQFDDPILLSPTVSIIKPPQWQ